MWRAVHMPIDTPAEQLPTQLTGVGRMLVRAGHLDQKTALSLSELALQRGGRFIATALSAGAIKSADLAHALSNDLNLPLIDLDAVDVHQLPTQVLDPKLAQQYQLLVLGRRGNRVSIGCADPTNTEAA